MPPLLLEKDMAVMWNARGSSSRGLGPIAGEQHCEEWPRKQQMYICAGPRRRDDESQSHKTGLSRTVSHGCEALDRVLTRIASGAVTVMRG